MKKMFVLLLLTSSFAWADNVDPRLFGLWHVNDPVYSDEDVTIRLDVILNANDATIKATCTYPRMTVDVAVTSKVRYTSKIIRPLENKEGSKKGPGDQECTVAIQPVDIYYLIKSDKAMEISDSTGFQKFKLHKD